MKVRSPRVALGPGPPACRMTIPSVASSPSKMPPVSSPSTDRNASRAIALSATSVIVTGVTSRRAVILASRSDTMREVWGWTTTEHRRLG